jgi:hypothetical protein
VKGEKDMSGNIVGIGEGASPIMPVPALDIVELLQSLVERFRIATAIRSALASLEIGGTTTIQLDTALVPKAFDRSLAGKGFWGTYHFVITEEGCVGITRTA